MNTNKPKTIATIDVNLVPTVSSRQWLEESVADHLSCILCGSSLEFTHNVSYVEGLVREEANCPSCRTRGRQSLHALQ